MRLGVLFYHPPSLHGDPFVRLALRLNGLHRDGSFAVLGDFNGVATVPQVDNGIDGRMCVRWLGHGQNLDRVDSNLGLLLLTIFSIDGNWSRKH